MSDNNNDKNIAEEVYKYLTSGVFRLNFPPSKVDLETFKKLQDELYQSDFSLCPKRESSK